MKTATASSSLSPVPFYGDTLFVTDFDGQPYAPMRPIVEGMGLAWQSQHAKLIAKSQRWSVTMIVTVAGDGKNREVVCIPVRKLPAWMASINPAKVAPEIRERVVIYQDECDDVLWDYWTKGQVVNPRAAAKVTPTPKALPVEHEGGGIIFVPQGLKLTPEYDRRKASTREDRHGIFELVQDIHMTMVDMGLNVSRSGIYRLIAGRFGVESIEFLAKDDVETVEKYLSDMLCALTGYNDQETPALPAEAAPTHPQAKPLPGSLPDDFAELCPSDKVAALLEAFEKSTDFAQGNTWAIESKILEIIKSVDIGHGMDPVQGMHLRQLVQDARVAITSALQSVQSSLNAARPMFWVLSDAAKLGRRVGVALPASPVRRGRGRPNKALTV